jgi:hypothetical protein
MWLNYRVGWGSTRDLGKMGTLHPPLLRTMAISGIALEGNILHFVVENEGN